MVPHADMIDQSLDNMPRFPEANDVPENISPDSRRPPNLNEQVCSRRSGSGGGGESEGDGGGSDEEGGSTSSLKTLVASHDSEADSGAEEDFPPSSDGREEHHQLDATVELPIVSQEARDIIEFLSRFGEVVNGARAFEFELNERGIVIGDQVLGDQADLSSSLVNGHSSDDRSVVSPDLRSLHSMSPGPGLGAWTEDMVMPEYHIVQVPIYLFSEDRNPLRLTPQRRYCRGLVASHLIIRDE